MRIKVQLPDQILYEGEIKSLSFEAEDGTFTMLPKHIDFASSLVPGIVRFIEKESGAEKFLATSRAVLVKQGALVTVSTTTAAISDGLDKVQEAIQAQLDEVAEEMQETRDSLSRLEVAIVKRYMEISE